MAAHDYGWLRQEPGPKLVREGLRHLGLIEGPGRANNPTILAWADEVAAAHPTPYNQWADRFYAEDSIPWCGLFMAVLAVRTSEGRPERMPPDQYLRAMAWANWGVEMPTRRAALGDVLVFVRDGGGHVGIYVCEDADCYHVLGGNQSDRVSIRRFPKGRLHAVRRPAYRQTPVNVRRIVVDPTGPVSVRED